MYGLIDKLKKLRYEVQDRGKLKKVEVDKELEEIDNEI